MEASQMFSLLIVKIDVAVVFEQLLISEMIRVQTFEESRVDSHLPNHVSV